MKENTAAMRPKILIVDDLRENLSLFCDILRPYNYDLSIAHSGAMALQNINDLHPDLILLDVVMPEMDGYEVLRRLKEDQATREIPVIFLTARDTPDDIVRGFEAGVVDYIAKPFHPKEMIARVHAHLEKARLLTGLKQLMEYSFHELYTPLSVIGSAMEIQELEHGPTDYTRMTRAACRTLQNIYDDLYFSLNHANTPHLRSDFDLTALLQERLHYFGLVAESRALAFDVILPGTVMVRLSRPDTERIVDNLLSNALKYAPERSRIAVTLEQEGKQRRFSISNSVAKEVDLEKIFRRYHREAHETAIGFGLGLDLVRSLCGSNGIALDASGGKGTFGITLTLPETP